MITDSLLMLSFGFYALVLHGGICLRITGTGKTLTAVSVVGETEEYGKSYSNYLSKILILNGL